jgi:hypothetical protein
MEDRLSRSQAERCAPLIGASEELHEAPLFTEVPREPV